jgi:hypothetical protein
MSAWARPTFGKVYRSTCEGDTTSRGAPFIMVMETPSLGNRNHSTCLSRDDHSVFHGFWGDALIWNGWRHGDCDAQRF